MNAITRDAAKLHQNSASLSPALIALGTARMNALSISSIVAIDTVSAANATANARRHATPERSTGVIV